MVTEINGNGSPGTLQQPARDGSVASTTSRRASGVFHTLANKLFLTSPSASELATSRLYHEGSAWNISDFPDNHTIEIVERLSRSQYSLKELVQHAKETDPEAFARAQQKIAEDQPIGKNKWSTTPVETLCEEFNSNLENGLNDEQILANREKYGPNVLEKERRIPIWRIFLEQFTSPVVILLLVAAIVLLGFREFIEGVAILIIITINATLATYMEKSAGDALTKLASLAAPHCKVIRNSKLLEIDAVDLVPGDIVMLATGDLIPADMRCIQVAELKTNEAILTGKAQLQIEN